MSSSLPSISVPTLPTYDGEEFPVGRIFCIGKNYAGHVREMGGTVKTNPPVFFIKHADAVICPSIEAPEVKYPPRSENLHFEGELVMALGSGGRDIPESEALAHVWGVALGCDMTRRDLQNTAKERRGPWALSKSFDHGAVIGRLQNGAAMSGDVSYTLSVNGAVRQSAVVRDMIVSPTQIIAELSTYLTLKAGDIIFTGTPEGVGEVVRNDKVSMRSQTLPDLDFVIT